MHVDDLGGKKHQIQLIRAIHFVLKEAVCAGSKEDMWKLEIGGREISVTLSSNRVGLVEYRMISQFYNIDSLFPIGLSILLRTLLITLPTSSQTKYSYSF